jgi:hypothetical protein
MGAALAPTVILPLQGGAPRCGGKGAPGRAPVSVRGRRSHYATPPAERRFATAAFEWAPYMRLTVVQVRKRRQL